MRIFLSLRAIIVGLFIAIALSATVPVASAGDPQIDAAIAQGIVGEKIDGYLGLVTGSADDAIRRKVAEVNAKRRALYDRLAREKGVTLEEVGIVTGEKQIANAAAGTYYMNANGQWIKK